MASDMEDKRVGRNDDEVEEKSWHGVQPWRNIEIPVKLY